MISSQRAVLLPVQTPDVPQELTDQAAALARAVLTHPRLSVTIVFHEPEPTSTKVPVFVGGNVQEALRATLSVSAGLCDLVGVEVTSITLNAEPGSPVAVQLEEVGTGAC